MPVSHDPLSPLASSIARCACIRTRRRSLRRPAPRWAEFGREIARLAGALRRAGVGPGDRVAFLTPNVPALLAAHFAVLQVHAALVAINTRLAAEEVGYILEHSGAKIVFVDPELAPAVQGIPHALAAEPLFVNVEDAIGGATGSPLDGPTYADFVAGADEVPLGNDVDDELRITSINYTSGTTGRPKGVTVHPPRRVPERARRDRRCTASVATASTCGRCRMFHCNGWCFPWAVTAAGGTHVLLRKVDPARDPAAASERTGVTHFCGAPTVLLHDRRTRPTRTGVRFDPPVRVATGGAPPSPTMLARMEATGRAT